MWRGKPPPAPSLLFNTLSSLYTPALLLVRRGGDFEALRVTLQQRSLSNLITLPIDSIPMFLLEYFSKMQHLVLVEWWSCRESLWHRNFSFGVGRDDGLSFRTISFHGNTGRWSSSSFLLWVGAMKLANVNMCGSDVHASQSAAWKHSMRAVQPVASVNTKYT